MDFVKIQQRSKSKGIIEIYPSFVVKNSRDLLTKGGAFYAVWDPDNNLWSKDIYDVQRLVDREIYAYKDKLHSSDWVECKTLEDFSSNSWVEFYRYLKTLPSSKAELDNNIIFANTETKKTDYVSHRLPYALEDGDISAYEELISTLYDPLEREKIEWAIGSIIKGDSKKIQKFLVFYGKAGSGKSTIMNIIQQLFEGYYITFDAKALTSSSNAFSTEMFRDNPLVAIQHDGDLSKIEDNTKLNSLVSHELMTMNEKYKASYTSRSQALLFLGTNKPVKITDAKSGVIRRLIDVRPSGRKIPPARYFNLVSQINFELGAIAKHCLDVYLSLGMDYYEDYVPIDMMLKTDVFYNFVEAQFDVFTRQNVISLKQAYDIYKTYCEEALVDFKLPMYKFREELKNYFDKFHTIYTDGDGKQIRSVYEGFKTDKFMGFDKEKNADKSIDISKKEVDEEDADDKSILKLESASSLIDEIYKDCKAQYSNSRGTPKLKWDDVKTTLKDLDTTKEHYVKLPENHIVIDFDLKDKEGNKSAELNLKAASSWPSTYAEFSKSGKGVHLHYIYNGDPTLLSRVYGDSIEIKVFTGNSSLRRKFTFSNNMPIATINSGLPVKGVKKMINQNAVKSERKLREYIERALNKDIHANTRPNVDFIYKVLEDAYESGLKYDVSDLESRVMTFAAKSTNQSDYCSRLVMKMHFKSDEPSENIIGKEKSDTLVFFDCEVFPNLFLINWKFQGKGKSIVRMINPSPQDVEKLFRLKLVGFNNRRYDNHILYARYLGYTNEELYNLSQKIVGKRGGRDSGFFGEAYNISYTDIYDFSSAANKKSLKKWEIELGLHHQELGLPWDQPVPEEMWEKVAAYCDNDVISTEAVFEELKGDFIARQIMAELAGMTVNDTTNSLSTRLIFGKNRTPQSVFHYRDLSKPVKEITTEQRRFYSERSPMTLAFKGRDGDESILPYFPGYEYKNGKSIYRDEEVGEGGYVYAEPGIYFDVALLDIASMHPSSTEDEYLFGEYTWKFSDIKTARIAIKHKDEKLLFSLFDGKFVPFYERALRGEFSLKDLSNALKTVINSVYGLTSASFDNPFRDKRNVDNIVAKRGALFMIDLKHEVQKRGFTVAHIKTDSIKIPNATKEIIDFVMDFGNLYGYTFEHEETYERMCLVNNAVYIARVYNKDGSIGDWTATGAQFAQKYVFKSLFSKMPLEFSDYCEVKNVTSGAIYLDNNEGRVDVRLLEKKLDKLSASIRKKRRENIEVSAEELAREKELTEKIALGHNYVFVGRIGNFVPVLEGAGGGYLMRELNEKYYNVTGTTGWRWMEAETALVLGKDNMIDISYHRHLMDDAIAEISKYGDFEQFVSSENVLEKAG